MFCTKCIKDPLDCLCDPKEECSAWLYYKSHPISIHRLKDFIYYIYLVPDGIYFCRFSHDGKKDDFRGDVNYSTYKMDYPFIV